MGPSQKTLKTENLVKWLIMYLLGDMKSFLFGGVCVAFLADVENLWWPVSTIVSRFSWFLPTLPLDMIVSAAVESVIKQTLKHKPYIPKNYTKNQFENSPLNVPIFQSSRGMSMLWLLDYLLSCSPGYDQSDITLN